MAQRSQTPDSISYDGNSTTIANLRTAFTSGNTVTAADINSLIGMINSWDNHTHTYTDAYQLATFGNNGDRNNYYETKITDAHDESSSDISSVSTGQTITASKHNDLRSVVNKLRVHDHNINDRTA